MPPIHERAGLMLNGKKLHTFHQSDLKNVQLCPERGRLGMLPTAIRWETDSGVLGTSCHDVIESCIEDMIAGQGPWSLSDMVDVARQVFDEIMAKPTSKWVKLKSAPPIHKSIERCLTTWYERVLPHLSPLATEVHFEGLTIHEDDERIIQLEGTIDYIDLMEGLADWKTAGRKWEPWEHQRWDIQPTVYTWALHRGLILPPNNAIHIEISDDIPWTWHVMNTDGTYQKITTTRGPDDWAWLKERVIDLASTIEAELPVWLKNDTHALCSPKWCDVWNLCKGKHFSDSWPK